MGEALIANGQPTAEHIKTELNTIATKQFLGVIAPKSSLFHRKKLTLNLMQESDVLTISLKSKY